MPLWLRMGRLRGSGGPLFGKLMVILGLIWWFRRVFILGIGFDRYFFVTRCADGI